LAAGNLFYPHFLALLRVDVKCFCNHLAKKVWSLQPGTHLLNTFFKIKINRKKKNDYGYVLPPVSRDHEKHRLFNETGNVRKNS
jgi:hypothetical protein